MEWLEYLGSWFLILFIFTMLFIVIGFLRFEITHDEDDASELSIRELCTYSALSVVVGLAMAYWACTDFLEGDRSWNWVGMLAFFASMQLINGFYYARAALRLSSARL